MNFDFASKLKEGEGDAPFKGEISTATYDQRGGCSIVRKVTAFGNENYYYDDGKTLTFLLNVSPLDSNEKIQKSEWSPTGEYYALLIIGSNRFASTTRLALYNFKEETVLEVIDNKTTKVIDFQFVGDSFVYSEESGGDK